MKTTGLRTRSAVSYLAQPLTDSILTRAGQLIRGRTVVLCYHSVRHRQLLPISTSATHFEQHLAWLSQTCEVVPLSSVLRPRPDPAPSDRPRAVITFDDGYRDNLRVALPLLAAYGLPASVFVTSGLLEDDPYTVSRFEKALGTTAEGIEPLDDAGLRELAASGIDVGAHTHTHRRLSKLSTTEVRRELTQAKEILEDVIQRPVASMSFPYGRPGYAYTATTIEQVRGAGYALAASLKYRGVTSRDCPLDIPRFVVYDQPLRDLKSILAGIFDPVGHYQDLVWSSRR